MNTLMASICMNSEQIYYHESVVRIIDGLFQQFGDGRIRHSIIFTIHAENPQRTKQQPGSYHSQHLDKPP
jgi:hypothetical protein